MSTVSFAPLTLIDRQVALVHAASALVALDLGQAPAARLRSRRADVSALRLPPPPHRADTRPLRRAEAPRALRPPDKPSTPIISALVRTARLRLSRLALDRQALASPARATETRAGLVNPLDGSAPRCEPPTCGLCKPPQRRWSALSSAPPRCGVLSPLSKRRPHTQ